MQEANETRRIRGLIEFERGKDASRISKANVKSSYAQFKSAPLYSHPPRR